MTRHVPLGPVSRAATALLMILGAAAFVLVGCPSYRDGVPGELARGRDDAESAARSAALALDLWGRDRSTRNLVSVQLSDAREEVAQAYKDVIELTVEERVDVERQRFLLDSMTHVLRDLSAADAAVRAVPGSAVNPDTLRRDLLNAADQLAGQYR
ncbi:hypothetical protein [Mycolicibacterium murale]|uniref:hypothetical protein n=1 Tax=Mycolicibacterium murale TaxID=182220 RepID=UPI0018745D30|nr:hypothetical protein [Mycolicibacterium murale]MCV7180583.1 hypothetical protein [Mycolicibacterium murale]